MKCLFFTPKRCSGTVDTGLLYPFIIFLTKITEWYGTTYTHAIKVGSKMAILMSNENTQCIGKRKRLVIFPKNYEKFVTVFV